MSPDRPGGRREEEASPFGPRWAPNLRPGPTFVLPRRAFGGYPLLPALDGSGRLGGDYGSSGFRGAGPSSRPTTTNAMPHG